MKSLKVQILLYLFLYIFYSCNDNKRTQSTSMLTDSDYSLYTKSDTLIKDTSVMLVKTIDSYLKWNKSHNDYKASMLETICINDNEFWYLKKDGSLLMDELDKLYSSKKNAYLAQEGRSTTLNVSVYSFKKSAYVSLYESTTTYAFRRDFYESFQTFINLHDKIYLVKIKSTPYIRKIINDYVEKYNIRYKEDFCMSSSFDLFISEGHLYVVPFYENDLIENDDEGDNIPNFMKIRLNNNLKFQLIDINSIIKEYE